MPSTKEQQRNELHKTIWPIGDDPRGAIVAIVANMGGDA